MKSPEYPTNRRSSIHMPMNHIRTSIENDPKIIDQMNIWLEESDRRWENFKAPFPQDPTEQATIIKQFDASLIRLHMRRLYDKDDNGNLTGTLGYLYSVLKWQKKHNITDESILKKSKALCDEIFSHPIIAALYFRAQELGITDLPYQVKTT